MHTGQSALRIAVASGKGGTGKTTVVTNLAVLLAQTGHQVAYMDGDVEAPNGHFFSPRCWVVNSPWSCRFQKSTRSSAPPAGAASRFASTGR